MDLTLDRMDYGFSPFTTALEVLTIVSNMGYTRGLGDHCIDVPLPYWPIFANGPSCREVFWWGRWAVVIWKLDKGVKEGNVSIDAVVILLFSVLHEMAAQTPPQTPPQRRHHRVPYPFRRNHQSCSAIRLHSIQEETPGRRQWRV